jgi:hypothetical protein
MSALFLSKDYNSIFGSDARLSDQKPGLNARLSDQKHGTAIVKAKGADAAPL